MQVDAAVSLSESNDGGLCFDYLKACEEKYRTNVTESIEEK